MENRLQHITLEKFKTISGEIINIPLSYETFGPELHTSPIVLINHALTGNSNVCGDKGWWSDVVGRDKIIDTNRFTVLSFNIPGNGYDGFFIENFEDITAKDVARIFLEGLKQLNISRLFAIIGSSVGGGIGWEMISLKNDITEKFVPVATDFKTSDWLHSQCLVQDFLLNHHEEPLEKARIHAMLCYRTPESINQRFNLERKDSQIRKSHDWLNYHGKSLNERFSLKAYKLMNQLLKTIDADRDSIKESNAEIHLISVDTDLFFPAFEIKNCYDNLIKNKQKAYYHEINSIHGHDAFLMEYEQLTRILKPIFI